MRQVAEVRRKKETFNIQSDEFRKGEWLKHIPTDIDIFDIEYKNNFLVISSATIKKTKSEKEAKENANERS